MAKRRRRVYSPGRLNLRALARLGYSPAQIDKIIDALRLKTIRTGTRKRRHR